MPFTEGETIGPYRLIEQLGQGGMATVFKAYHAALDRYVAIKVLHQAFTLEPNFLARFQREAQVVARLEHPNIVPVYDYSEYEGRPYLVLKFIEGETLKARLRRKPLSHDELMKIVESVGEGLHYAHQKGVLHRDVKPSNVLLANDGRIYLADFGLARIAQAGESTISSDVMLGTPQYISPEQAKGVRELDNGTDIYSFGVLLYELLVGQVPYSADTPYSIIHDHIYAPLPLPRARNPDIPEAVERVLLKALSKERDDRFQDVGMMVAAWKRAWSEGAEVPAGVPAAPVIGVETLSVPADEPSSADGEGQVMGDASSQPIQPAPAAAEGAPPSALVGDQAEGQSAGESVVSGRKKSRRVWWVVFIVFAVLCLCVFVFLATRPRAGRQQAESALSETPVPTQVIPSSTAALLETAGPHPSATLAPAPTLRRTGSASALDLAHRRVTMEPNSPFSHLGLAVAYWDVGLSEEAEAEFSLAMELAGENNPIFYNRAGEYLLARRQWGLAAQAFAKAVKYAQDPAPRDMMEKLEQALYLAASEVEIEGLIEQEVFDRVDPVFQEIVRARSLLYHRDPQGAKDIMRRLSEAPQSRIEIKLLEAEYLLYQDETEQAKQKLTSLIEDLRAPQWVRMAAEAFLKEILK